MLNMQNNNSTNLISFDFIQDLLVENKYYKNVIGKKIMAALKEDIFIYSLAVKLEFWVSLKLF